MTEFLKDKFSSRPATDKYRQNWEQTFGRSPREETVVAVAGSQFQVRVTLEAADGTTRTTVGDTRTGRGRQMAHLRTGQTWVDPNLAVEICGECGDQRQVNGNCPHCGADAE